MRKRMRRRKWSGARRTRSCAKREMVVKRKWLRHRENVHRVGARPELVPSVSRPDAPARLLEDVVAAIVRRFLLVFFPVVFLEGTGSTVGYRMAWLASAQALCRATERRSGPSRAAWTDGSAGWRGGGPWTGWKAAGIGAMQSCVRSAAGDRRAPRGAAGQRSGPSQAAWIVGSASWRDGGPQTYWKAAGSGAVRSCRRSVAGDRRGRLELERCWQA